MVAFSSGGVLTSFGSIVFTSITGGTTTAASTNIGTPVTLTNGISSGGIGSPNQFFSNAPLNLTGTISSSNPSGNLVNIGTTISSGNIILPNTVILPSQSKNRQRD